MAKKTAGIDRAWRNYIEISKTNVKSYNWFRTPLLMSSQVLIE